MAVIVDAMGGDFAPTEIVNGAIAAARDGIEIVLVGKQDELAQFPLQGLSIQVQHAPDTIGMDEHAARAVRKKPESSIRVASALLKKSPGSALVSAGHTGAVMASALLDLGRMEGIERPAIATILPTTQADVVVLDVGANVDCKPHQLVQFAHMGAAYARNVLNVSNPRVALLNIGSEPAKGNELSLAAHALLKESGLNFIGNVEGDHLYAGECDVAVTDGFVGNVLLKTTEGVSHLFQHVIAQVAQEMGEKARALGPLLAKLERFKTTQPNYAGAPLLGVEGACIITHGASKAETIKHAIRIAQRFATSDTLNSIRQTGQRRQGDGSNA
jgi:glycerol-3-phosphate acyltransferase PlsX